MSRSKHQHKKNYLGFSTSKLKKLTSRKIRTRARSALSKAETDENALQSLKLRPVQLTNLLIMLNTKEFALLSKK